MKEDKGSQRKEENTVKKSKINAGGEVHIGDKIVINQVQSAPDSKPNRSSSWTRWWLFLIFIIVLTGVLSYLVQKLSKPYSQEENAAIVNPALLHQKTEVLSGNSKSIESDKIRFHEKNNDTIVQSLDENEKKEGYLQDLRGKTARIGYSKNNNLRLSLYEVTVGQYLMYCRLVQNNFPFEEVDTTHKSWPMTHISWDEASRYCEFVGGRLPTFEEWELAALTLGSSDSVLQSNIEKFAWYKNNSGDQLHSVGSISKSRDIKFHDLFGNVEEWCSDGPNSNQAYLAGGFFNSYRNTIGLKKKDKALKSWSSETIGFRVVYDW